MTKHESKDMTAIRRNPLFHGLPTARLVHLSQNATVLDLPRGEYVHHSGVRSPGVYAVVSGCIMLNVGAPERSKVIELIGAGGHVGLAATMLGVAETVSAETLTDCTLLLIPRAALIECAADTPQFALQLAMTLSRQVQRLMVDIEAFSLHSGHERVADYLLQLAGGNGTRPRTRSRAITLPAKKSIIASRLNLTPEYFSRTLHELIDAGAITVNGRQITVLDPVRLRQHEA